MAVAILALVVALSSSATAALMITGAQVKNGTIAGKDIKNKSVTGKDLKKKSVAKKHIRKNAITSQLVKDGSLSGDGPRASARLTGEHVRDGSVTTTDLSKNAIEVLGGGASGFEVVTARRARRRCLVQPASVSATCPAGKVAISANAYWDGASNLVAPQVRRNGPSGFTAKDSFPVAVDRRRLRPAPAHLPERRLTPTSTRADGCSAATPRPRGAPVTRVRGGGSPDPDAVARVEPQAVPGRGAEGLVELVEVPHDVGPELRR